MRNTQYFTTIRKLKNEKVTYIILGANKKNALKEYNNGTYIEYQIKKIKEIFNDVEIIFISGLESFKIYKNKSGFRIVENVNYYDSGEFEQIRLGLQNAETDNIFLIPDNFTDFNHEYTKISSVYLSTAKEAVNPGCIYNEYVESICYGIPNEINKSFFVTGNELVILKKYLYENQKIKNNFTSFEVINEIINKGAKFKVI